MIQFKNVKLSKQVFIEDVPLPVCYFEDDRGRDWYTLRDKSWQGETAFIAVSPDGFITTGARDPNFLTLTEGISIYEVDAADYRDDIGASFYRYEAGKITKYEQPENERSDIQKAALMDKAASAIAPLQDAVDMKMATDEEVERLLAWKKYRVLLSRVDTSLAPDIEWPPVPVAD